MTENNADQLFRHEDKDKDWIEFITASTGRLTVVMGGPSDGTAVYLDRMAAWRLATSLLRWSGSSAVFPPGETAADDPAPVRQHWCGRDHDHSPHRHPASTEEMECLGVQGAIYGQTATLGTTSVDDVVPSPPTQAESLAIRTQALSLAVQQLTGPDWTGVTSTLSVAVDFEHYLLTGEQRTTEVVAAPDLVPPDRPWCPLCGHSPHGYVGCGVAETVAGVRRRCRCAGATA